MALHECGAENLVLPVDALAEKRRVAVGLVVVGVVEHALLVEFGLILRVLAEVHHFKTLCSLLPGHIAIVGDVGVTCRTAAGGDKHYTVGAGGTVNRAGRGILEHVDAHDITRGDCCERVDCGLAVGAAHPVETAD